MDIRVEKIGRRYYFRNIPFEARGMLAGQGAHWDARERAWWVGDLMKSRDLEDRLLRTYGPLAVPPKQVAAASLDKDAPQIIGKAMYKNHMYYLLDKDLGEKVLLMFHDGSAVFPVAVQDIAIKQRYLRPFSFNELQDRLNAKPIDF